MKSPTLKQIKTARERLGETMIARTIQSLKFGNKVVITTKDGIVHRGTFDREFEIHGGIWVVKYRTLDEGHRRYIKVSQIQNVNKV